MACSSTGSGVPPGFRFHPTDEELLLYYLKKKVSLEKFDLEVVREVDLNKIEPWDLQERCKIGATPQNEWYFFSHKDRKYPTGSRTNRATNAGFWKATGRDKCIRGTYKKIGMRKTLVFYCGRAPHGQKTDWIMHEYRLEESDDDHALESEDGWVICRVFKKKCFFKTGASEGRSSHGGVESSSNHMMNSSTSSHDQSRAFMYGYQQQHQQHFHQYKHELALHYPDPHLPTNPYSGVQVQDLLPNFSLLPAVDDSSAAAALQVDGCGRDDVVANDWATIDNMEGRYGSGGGGGASTVAQMNQMSQPQRGGEMDLWGYGK